MERCWEIYLMENGARVCWHQLSYSTIDMWSWGSFYFSANRPTAMAPIPSWDLFPFSLTLLSRNRSGKFRNLSTVIGAGIPRRFSFESCKNPKTKIDQEKVWLSGMEQKIREPKHANISEKLTLPSVCYRWEEVRNAFFTFPFLGVFLPILIILGVGLQIQECSMSM